MCQRREKGLNDPEGPGGPCGLWGSRSWPVVPWAEAERMAERARKPSLDLCHSLSLGVSEPQFPHV